MANWWKFWRLSPLERWLLAQAIFLLPLTAVGLRVVGFRRWQTLLARLAPVEGTPAGGELGVLTRQGRGLARLVDAAARQGPFRVTCLPRSLTLWWLLRCRGIDGELRIGVRKAGNRLEAHAWIEFRGVVLNDRADVDRAYPPFGRPIEPLGTGAR